MLKPCRAQWLPDPAGQPDVAAGARTDPGPPVPSSLGRRFGEAEAVMLCDDLIDLLSVFFNVSGRQLRSPSRTATPVARVRQIGMYVAHVSLGLRMSWVGTGFGRNKSTVVHACHTVEDMRDDEDFDAIVARVERLAAIAFRPGAESGRE